MPAPWFCPVSVRTAADRRHEDDLFDAHGDPGGGDGLFSEVFGEPRDDEHSERHGEHVERGGNCLDEDLADEFRVGFQASFWGAGEERGGGDFAMEPECAEGLDDDGGKSDTGHTEGGDDVPTPHEEGVEQEIRGTRDDEEVACLALGGEAAVHGEGEQEKDASAEKHVHVGQRGPEVLVRCAEEPEKVRRDQGPEGAGGEPEADGAEEGLSEHSDCEMVLS